MIPRSVVNDFLQRPLRDCNTYKSLTDDQLDEAMNQLPAKPPIWFKLYRHQKVCLIAGAQLKRLYIMADTGMGKTLLSLALIKYFKRLKLLKCTLVLVPTKSVATEWGSEIEKHSPKTTFCILEGSSQEKWRQLLNKPTIAVTTYAGLLRMVCSLTEHKKKSKNRLLPNKGKLTQLCSLVNGLILDEAPAVKSRGKLPFRICRQISKHSEIVFALSGTPFNDPMDLWAQMCIVDHGETLGETLGLFREAFFASRTNYWGGLEYIFREKMKGILSKLLNNRSLSYEASATDLPRVISITKPVKLPADAVVYAQRAEEELLNARGDYRLMKNAFLRMRQISSGYLGYYDDDEGTKAQLEFSDHPKLDALIDLIQSIRHDQKIIVFYELNYSADMVSRALTENKVDHVRIYGGTKDHDTLRTRFNSDHSCRVMLLQNASGMGLNIQIASYGIYYESPVTPSLRKQTRRRVERQGSAHDRVFIYDLVVAGTYDQRILRALAAGEDLLKSIRDCKASIRDVLHRVS